MSDSDRNRDAILANPNPSPHRDAGNALHLLTRELIELEVAFTDDQVDVFLDKAIRMHPGTTKASVQNALWMILGLLPPLEWKLLAAEKGVAVDGIPNKRRIDFDFVAPEPIIVGDHIGDIVTFELKLGGHPRINEFDDVEAQAAEMLTGGIQKYGERMLGVVQAFGVAVHCCQFRAPGAKPIPFTDGLLYPTGTRQLDDPA